MLEPPRARGRKPDVAEHALLGERTDDGGLQMYRGAWNAEFLLHHTRAERPRGKRNNGVGVRMFLDQAVNLFDGGYEDLRKDLKALAQVPQVRIGNRGADLLQGSHREISQALGFDLRLKKRSGDDRCPMTAGLERRAERDIGVHIAGAPQCRQQNVHRSNFVDRMMEEVVRSTPSSAPIRSMTWSISATDAVAATAIRSTSPLTECRTRTCAIARSAALTARVSFGPTLIITCARTAPRPCSGARRTPYPTMIPSRCSLSILLWTLVRERPTSLASCAVEARPFSRSASSSFSSMASMAIRRFYPS